MKEESIKNDIGLLVPKKYEDFASLWYLRELDYRPESFACYLTYWNPEVNILKREIDNGNIHVFKNRKEAEDASERVRRLLGVVEFANEVFVGNKGPAVISAPNLSDFGLELDKEFIEKRQNRIVMEITKEKEKQPRDAHGHFAPKTGAKKTSSKKTEFDYKGAFLQQEELLKEKEEQIHKLEENVKKLSQENNCLRKTNEHCIKKIGLYSKALGLLEHVTGWYHERFPWYKMLFYKNEIGRMNDDYKEAVDDIHELDRPEETFMFGGVMGLFVD